MKFALICLYAGGVMHIGWAVFHFFFPRIFKWQTALEPLDSLNRSIMQVLNLCLTFYFAVAAYLTLVYSSELLGTPWAASCWPCSRPSGCCAWPCSSASFAWSIRPACSLASPSC